MPPAQTAIDNDALLALHEAGKSYRQIAALAGIHHNTVAKYLKRLTPRKATEIYKNHKADILAEFQRKILSFCGPEEIKQMVKVRGLSDFGILYDKEQIERGHGVDARPLVMIQINTAVDKPVDNLIPNHINSIEVK